jgi:hypothetical protein
VSGIVEPLDPLPAAVQAALDRLLKNPTYRNNDLLTEAIGRMVLEDEHEPS